MERKSGSDIAGYRQVRNLPTPVNQGIYEVTCREIDEGIPSLTQPVLLRGIVHKPFANGTGWKIKTRGCEVVIKWFMDVIPPNVVEGKRYAVLGNLLTANLGNRFVVDDCVVIERYSECRTALKEFYKRFVFPINQYIEKPDSDTYFIKE